ncbi:hypothetical protein [Desulfoferula mesophila]|uniref:Uncharacterized protein n=1 Tax=Desulfoferula mesophila TaxID=3058419 RepID=A0AAU9EZD6_9BACT|nr:hypothetical protein FAK_39510 [Desulfoferula mesophilus]
MEEIAKLTIQMIGERGRERPKGILAIRARLQKVSNQKANLIANLKDAPELGRILKDELVALDIEERRLQETLEVAESSQHQGEATDLASRVRQACEEILAVWERAPVKKKNQLLKALVHRAEVDAESKEVTYYLAIPLNLLTGPENTHPGGGSRGGCTQVVAEVHGNRTHLPPYSDGTPDLKF